MAEEDRRWRRSIEQQLARARSGGGSAGPHSHDEYLTQSEADQLYAALGAVGGVIHNHDLAYAPLSHTHSEIPLPSDGTPSTVGDTGSAGNGTAYARWNHVHGKGSHTHDYEATGAAAAAVSTHAAAADPHAGYQKESEKGAASGYAGLDATAKVPLAQLPTGTTSSTVSVGDHTHAGGTPAAWRGSIVAAYNDGDPATPFRVHDLVAGVSPTPTQITVTAGRCLAFMLDTALVVNRIRWRGLAATTNLYRFRLYRDSDSAAMSAEFTVSTTAAWNSVAPAAPFTLAANVLYWVAVTAAAVGTTAGIQACIPLNRTPFNLAPSAAPGGLSVVGAAKSPLGQQAQITVAAGALPATMPARTAPGAWVGGVPQFWLDNNSAA